ncbi:aldo/keto reductase [Halobacteriales archaeon QH_10_65_19]|nr:MAG: aldo/keto reductase [Halobacteriales archaeon QH_10_65_19]
MAPPEHIRAFHGNFERTEPRRPEEVQQQLEDSLNALQTEVIDLYQYHSWGSSQFFDDDVLAVLDKARDAGKIRHIGVTNFDAVRLEDLLDAGVPVVSNQVQYSLLDTRPEREMVDLCERRDMKLLCYGTLAGGFLTSKFAGEPDPGEATDLENRSLTKYKLIIEEVGGWEAYQNLLGTVSDIADKHGVSIANVATRYVLEKPRVGSAIVGARNTRHIESNQRTLAFELDEEDHRTIEVARARLAEVPGGVYSVERDRDSRHAKIMNYNLNQKQDDVTRHR